MIIRLPTLADASGLGHVWEDTRQAYSEMDPTVFNAPDPADEGLGGALAEQVVELAMQPDRFARVAESQGRAVGFVTATMHHPDVDAGRDVIRDSSRRYVKLDLLVVGLAHQRLGVGSALVDAVEGWARDGGATLLKVGTYAAGPAVGFYEARGFRTRSVILDKFIGD